MKNILITATLFLSLTAGLICLADGKGKSIEETPDLAYNTQEARFESQDFSIESLDIDTPAAQKVEKSASHPQENGEYFYDYGFWWTPVTE